MLMSRTSSKSPLSTCKVQKHPCNFYAKLSVQFFRDNLRTKSSCSGRRTKFDSCSLLARVIILQHSEISEESNSCWANHYRKSSLKGDTPMNLDPSRQLPKEFKHLRKCLERGLPRTWTLSVGSNGVSVYARKKTSSSSWYEIPVEHTYAVLCFAATAINEGWYTDPQGNGLIKTPNDLRGLMLEVTNVDFQEEQGCDTFIFAVRVQETSMNARMENGKSWVAKMRLKLKDEKILLNAVLQR
ncbi:hypothetical protein SCHPADRAFT_662807 [Schizopora paradoxa]|uniref:Uncharacterized protein n=1 Tax=Schizopora paradoxa TaxID=27342 RepID=A0A0H2R5M7_9AGAM|nr:hypothetical protein SCHPADRAFT_662807 [Schizopora paradoxa]